MIKVVSLLSEDKFRSAQPVIPEGLTIVFLDQVSDCDIIKACEGADCLFSAASGGELIL